MERTYEEGWVEIFGNRDATQERLSQEAEKDRKEDRSVSAFKTEAQRVEPPIIDAAEIDWKSTHALSIRQPWAELVILGEQDEENRNRSTKLRERIAIYATLSKEDLDEAVDYDLDPETLPRGFIIGTVELYACDEGVWKLREPKRLAEPIKPEAHPQPVWFYPFGRD